MRPRPQPKRRARVESGVHRAASRTAGARARLELALALLAEERVELAEHEISEALDLLAREQGALEETRAAVERRAREVEDARQEALRAKAQLLSIVSHELRTPLNAMLGYAAMLSRGVGGALPREQRRKAERIEVNGRELLAVIDAMLELTSLEMGVQLELTELDLGELVREVLAKAMASASGRDLRVELSIDTPAPRLRTDTAKLRRALGCVIDNALKFTREGEVRIDARPSWDGVEISVRDTGIGIALEDRARIFDAFQQVDGSPTRAFGGAGLGLAIARRIARLLGGDVTLESALGEGSTFVVRVRDMRP